MPDALLADCGGPHDLQPEHMTTCWETEPTTPAETAIMTFLASQPTRYRKKRMLHVGVGNSALPMAFVSELDEYLGLTISIPEIERFNRLMFKKSNARVLLANKYDMKIMRNIEGNFDLIVDTLLKSVACCEKHFSEMMVFFAARLKPGGSILTTRNGIHFSWSGNTQRAYTPGAQTHPAFAQFRVLGFEQLTCLAENLGLRLEAEANPPLGPSNPGSDQVLMLTKLGANKTLVLAAGPPFRD